MNATRERPEIRFLTSGDVSAHERAAAERAVWKALSAARGVTSVQVTLSVVADRSLPRPALAQAVVELDGGACAPRPPRPASTRPSTCCASAWRSGDIPAGG